MPRRERLVVPCPAGTHGDECTPSRRRAPTSSLWEASRTSLQNCSSLASPDEIQRRLTVAFPVWRLVWHLGRHRLARHLACGVSYCLLVEALGLFLLFAPCCPDPLAVGGGAVLGLEERLEEVNRNRQDDGRVLLAGDLTHRLEQPKLQRRRALQTVCGLP